MIPPELEPAILAAVDSTVGVMIVSADEGTPGRVYVNRRAGEVLGWPAEELAAMPLLEVLAPEERPRIERLLGEWRKGAAVPVEQVLTYLAKDGRRIPVATTRYDVLHAGTRYAVAFFSDISERLRIQEALRASEERFRLLAEASPDTITIIQDGRFVYANPAAVSALGFDDTEDFLARPLSQLLEPDEMRTMMERIARVRAGEKLAPTEYRGRRKDGSFASLEISSISIELNGGPAIVAFGRDLTERKVMQAKLIRSEQMATVGQLAAGVAHEINNPLAYVTLNLEHVRRRLAEIDIDPGTARELAALLDQASDGAHRVASIAKQLLWFARPGIDPSSASVAEAVEAALRLGGSSLKRCGRIEVRCDGDLVVRGEARRLTQVLLNLLLNAAEAQDRGRSGESGISIWARADGDCIVIDVSDAGEGIPEIDLERVFDPFFTTKASGTGLGLAVSRSIIESFGGSIVALRRPEGGTTMRARLTAAPARSGEPVVAAQQAKAAAVRTSSILVVDDEPLVAGAVAAMLSRKHRVETCSDPGEALERLLSGPIFDVVLCDLTMPEITGMDLFARVREARPEYQNRFVFITGGPTSNTLSEFVSRRSTRTIAKPFGEEALEDAIAACLGE